MTDNQKAPEAPKATCPSCSTASMLKDPEKIKAWFDLVRKVLEASNEVKNFLAANS
jgi:hypothetical protein